MAKGILADITVAELKANLSYNAETGQFAWRVARGSRKAGSIAGCVSKSSHYVEIGIAGKLYLAHRLAWLYTYKSWPLRTIDHINGSKTDNRIANLRDVEHCENMRNRGEQSNNTSGASGVTWKKDCNRWYARAFRCGKEIQLGRFHSRHEAIDARKAWEARNPVESTQSFLRKGITLNGMPVTQ